MDLFPNAPLDDSIPQHRIWDAVREAFGDEEGAAFYRYPIFSRSGLVRHEADILVALRQYGLFLIEVKGYVIDTIRAIEGHVWRTAPWYTDEEYPVQQADDQLFALKDWLRDGPQVPLHYAVALPFVSRAEWEGAGWHRLPTTGCVRTADDLTPDALRTWVKTASAAFPNVLSTSDWNAVRRRLGRTLKTPAPAPPTLVPAPRPTIHRYPGRIPTADEIRAATGLATEPAPRTDTYHYLVATAILERYRGRRRDGQPGPEFAPSGQLKPVQVQKGQTEPQAQLMFDRALDWLMTPWLHRQGLQLPFGPIEYSYFLDAVEQVTGADDRMSQYAHDARTWRTVIGRLDLEGLDLSDPAVFAAQQGRFAHPDLATLSAELQAAFHRALSPSEITRERAARRFIAEGYTPPPIVVMEGFSFLRPLQQFFAQRVIEQGADLHVIHAYRDEQAFGFRALDLTYDAASGLFAGAAVRPIDTPLQGGRDLDRLKTALFNETPPPGPPVGDPSVRVQAFDHRHAEVKDCLEQIVQLLDGGFERKNIRVVTRDADTYRDLLLEELDLLVHAKEAAGEDASRYKHLFQIPPRQLLLTPLGRFVLTLYNVWEEGRLRMEPDQFATILSSGLLGHRIQASVARFLSVREQVFANCLTQDDWERELSHLDALRTGGPERARLPSTGLVATDAGKWTEALHFVVRLAGRLFDGTPRSIGEHVEQLRKSLREVDPLRMFDTERTVLDRIEAVLADLGGIDTAAISTGRFRDVLNGLVKDRETSDLGDDPDRIAVMAPEGLDGSVQRAVFFLGLDSRLVPRAYAEPWPFLDDRLEADLAQDRYLFLAAVRAATERLFLSFPRVSQRDELQPSPYLQEAADLLLRSLAPLTVPLSPPAPAPAPTAPPAPGLAYPRDYARDPYTLSQLYHFALCPYRYKLERLDERSGMYVSKFQLRFLARGIWLYSAYARWAQQGGPQVGADAIRNQVLTLAKQVRKDVFPLFPGFSRPDWYEVWRGVKSAADFWAKAHLKDDKIPPESSVEVIGAGPLAIHIPDDGGQEIQVHLFHARSIQLPNGYPPRLRALPPDAFQADWLMHSSKPKRDRDGNLVEAVELKKLRLTLLAHHFSAAQGWQDGASTAYKYEHWGNARPAWLVDDMQQVQTMVAEHVGQIEKNTFPKNPGDHCRLCSAQQACLGVEPMP